jgi:hypothetical protein
MILLLVIIIVAASMLAMGVGLLLSGRRLRGSCGANDSCACSADDAPAHCPRRRSRSVYP